MYKIEELHYLVKLKINKVDSLQNRNFFVEQIDSYLNEALFIFIDNVLKEAEATQRGLEFIQQLIKTEDLVGVKHENFYEFSLPLDYYRHLESSSVSSSCSSTIKHFLVQADDLQNFLTDPFYKPSLLWREAGYQLENNKLKVWTNNEFELSKATLTYIKKHPRLANPLQSRAGTYKYADGTVAAQQDLILDSQNQPDIIADIAALIIGVDMADPNNQHRLNKLLTNVYK